MHIASLQGKKAKGKFIKYAGKNKKPRRRRKDQKLKIWLSLSKLKTVLIK
uniref:Uncharacterized protein n=1 Tax=Arundo donax TaxID=35708 RepID=A0A0A9GY36_ARUDO